MAQSTHDFERRIKNYLQRCCKGKWKIENTATEGEKEVTITYKGRKFKRYFQSRRMFRWHKEEYFTEFSDYMDELLKKEGLYIG